MKSGEEGVDGGSIGSSSGGGVGVVSLGMGAGVAKAKNAILRAQNIHAAATLMKGGKALKNALAKRLGKGADEGEQHFEKKIDESMGGKEEPDAFADSFEVVGVDSRGWCSAVGEGFGDDRDCARQIRGEAREDKETGAGVGVVPQEPLSAGQGGVTRGLVGVETEWEEGQRGWREGSRVASGGMASKLKNLAFGGSRRMVEIVRGDHADEDMHSGQEPCRKRVHTHTHTHANWHACVCIWIHGWMHVRIHTDMLYIHIWYAYRHACCVHTYIHALHKHTYCVYAYMHAAYGWRVASMSVRK